MSDSIYCQSIISKNNTSHIERQKTGAAPNWLENVRSSQSPSDATARASMLFAHPRYCEYIGGKDQLAVESKLRLAVN
jgi:hypothetical protein